MLGEWHSLARFEDVGTIDPLHWLGALLQHVGPDFLFFTGDHNLRHHTGYGGMLNIVFLPLLLAGSVCLLRKLFRQRDTFWIFLALFGITCLVPVSLTQENLPHALRSLPVFLPLTMVIILGYGDLESRLKERGRTVMVALTAPSAARGLEPVSECRTPAPDRN
jgi:drug/metabolite transporter (DMT)-like permease